MQDYARRFQIPTCCLRGVVPIDPWNPDGVLYDLLAMLVDACLQGEIYAMSAPALKQVRETLHARDAAGFIELFCDHPHPGEVFHLSGGADLSYRAEDIVPLIEAKTGRHLRIALRADAATGEIPEQSSDLRNIQDHYPAWLPRYSLGQIIDELIEASRATRP